MSVDLVKTLCARLDDDRTALDRLDSYYAGKQSLAFLSPEARTAVGNRFGVMCSNIPRLSVTSLAERLRVTGFTPDQGTWDAWVANDLDQLAPVAHREALTLGRSFVIVWGDAAGNPLVTVESARQVAVQRDPATRAVTAAVKRWVAGERAHAVLYLPDEVIRYTSTVKVTDEAAIPATGWKVTGDPIKNPLGVVPVVPLVNTDRLLGTDGTSELSDLIPLVDGLNKLLADLMVGSEYYARPRRWATGTELEERPVLDADGTPETDGEGEPVTELVNPYPDGDRMMINESPEGKFGQLPAADLAAYENGVRVLLTQIGAVSALPSHYLGVFSDQPSSADALRAAEASLAARAEARQASFGRAWEQVARLIVAVKSGADPTGVDVTVKWADPATRSVAQEADAVVKLFQTGLLPASYALARLGYTDDEVRAIRAARRAEALDGAGTDLAALLPA